jgi:predicted nucleic acid-binding protein
VILVDTNVLVDLLEDDPEWADWSTARMRELSFNHELVINPIIYAELSLTFTVVEDLDDAIAELELRFKVYRVIADCLINTKDLIAAFGFFS